MKEFLDKIAGVFINFSAVQALEVLFIAVVIYFLFAFLKKNNAKYLIAFFSIFVLLTGVLYVVSPEFFGFSYLLLPVLFALVIILIFASEIRREVWKRSKFRITEQKQTGSSRTVEDSINEIIKALINMAKKNTGALVVLAEKSVPSQILDSGVILNSDISSQLIESVFFPNTPLHDGAMIIKDDVILAAGCFLPLSQAPNIPKELGTRHRAGLGASEQINAISIIVSEETGIISIAGKGKFTRYADADMLRVVLEEYYFALLYKAKR